MQASQLMTPVRQVIDLLVARRYVDIVRITKGIRLDAKMIQEAIDEYGRDLVAPPKEWNAKLDVVEVEGAEIPTWSVRCPLWTEQEGMSDLTVDLTVVDHNGSFSVELDDIHVL